MKKIIALQFFLLFSFSISLNAAVHLSETGTGQAIIIPYYTVADSMNTYLSINNTTDQAKAIKVHIKESKTGAALYSFNLYLDGNDIWTMAMGQANDYIKLVTNDQSCAFNLGEAAQDPDTPEGNAWEWQTGLIEIIEMAVVQTDSNSFVADISDCITLKAAWMPTDVNNHWFADATTNMSPVSGGLRADATIIDVNQGHAFSVPGSLFASFHPDNTINHTRPGSSTPDLSSGSRESLILHRGESIRTTWPTGYEAISALLVKNSLETEFDDSQSVAATSEIVFSFPTLFYHLADNNSTTPFIIDTPPTASDGPQFRFPGNNGIGFSFFDREAFEVESAFGCTLLPPDEVCPPVDRLSHAVNTFTIKSQNEFIASTISGPARENVRSLYNPLDGIAGSEITHGKIELRLATGEYAATNSRGINSSNHQPQHHHGLPVVGFTITTLKNAHAQPGLLATYTTAKPLYGTREVDEPSP